MGRDNAVDVASFGDDPCRNFCREGMLGGQGSAVLVGDGGEPRREAVGRDVPVVHPQVPHGAIGGDLLTDRREVGRLVRLGGRGGWGAWPGAARGERSGDGAVPPSASLGFLTRDCTVRARKVKGRLRYRGAMAQDIACDGGPGGSCDFRGPNYVQNRGCV